MAAFSNKEDNTPGNANVGTAGVSAFSTNPSSTYVAVSVLIVIFVKESSHFCSPLNIDNV